MLAQVCLPIGLLVSDSLYNCYSKCLFHRNVSQSLQLSGCCTGMLSYQQICNHGGSQRAIRVADGGLLGLSLPCHHCGCSVQVSSAVLCDQCRFLPEMVLYHSVLGKIIPEALSCPHFLLFLYYCFILLMFLQGRAKEV